MSGKGDTPRPLSISQEEWEERWKRIFQRPKDERLAEMRDLLNSVDRVEGPTGR